MGERTEVFAKSRTAVLWPDTFTDHLAPSVGRAAVRVMEAAGMDIALPPGRVCCGLTYVSTGQLDRARAVMRHTLDTVEPLLDLAVPVVVLEPSCAAALKTDLPELLGDDPRAALLAASVRTFAQALQECAPDWEPPLIGRPVAGQTHCHQHAVLGDEADRRLRERAGLEGELSGGCCGLAGNFGFEKGHYGVSVACAEDQLLPSVRAAGQDTEILADGFSCRTQLQQLEQLGDGGRGIWRRCWRKACDSPECELLDQRRVLGEVAVPHPGRPHPDVRDPGPREPVPAVGIHGEVGREQAFAIGAGGEVGDALDLRGDRVVPADDERDTGVGPEVEALAGRLDGVEDDLELVTDGESDDGGLGGAVRGDGRLDGELVPAKEPQQLVALHEPGLPRGMAGSSLSAPCAGLARVAVPGPVRGVV